MGAKPTSRYRCPIIVEPADCGSDATALGRSGSALGRCWLDGGHGGPCVPCPCILCRREPQAPP